MKIGIDLDDVLADFKKGWIHYHNQQYGTNLTVEDFINYDFGIVFKTDPAIIIKRVMEFYQTPEFGQLKPLAGAQAVIRKISKKNQLFVITSRPDWIEQETKQWLGKHFGAKTFNKIILSNQFGGKDGPSTKKSIICQQLGVSIMIEDAPTYAKDIATAGIEVLLMDQPWNRQEPENDKVKRIANWRQAEEYLIERQS